MFIGTDSILYHYHLGWDTKTKSILVKMRKEIFDLFPEMFTFLCEQAERSIQKFNLKPFVLTKNKIGVNACGIIHVEEDQSATLSFKLPKVKRKKPSSFDYSNLYEIIVTLSVLLDYLQYTVSFKVNDEVTDDIDLHQQAFLNLSFSPGDHYGFALHADISMICTDWLRNKAEKYKDIINPLLVSAALDSYYKLWTRKGIVSFVGTMERGFLSRGVSGIYTSEFGIDRSQVSEYDREERPYGYQTFSHNVNVPTDQLIHLAVFSAMLQFIRENPS